MNAGDAGAPVGFDVPAILSTAWIGWSLCACSGDPEARRARSLESAASECASATDSAESALVWPGGRLAVSVKLDADDEVAAERAADIDDRLSLQLRYFAEEPTDCLAADAVILVSTHVDLDRNLVLAVPAGRTCAYAYTEDDPVEEDPETGERYQIRCADTSLLVAVEPDEDEWAYINVACSRVEVESD